MTHDFQDDSPDAPQRDADADYVVELSSAPHLGSTPAKDDIPASGESNDAAVRYLTIQFECCKVYAPIYRNAAGTAYAGHCPRCLKAVRLPIGPGGTNARIFTAR